ncbi:MAG: acyl-CoA carboxylase subunit beta, partial [Deltaproteobacteria bacterium]
VASLNGYAEIVRRNTGLSGVVPQISAMVGACTGGAAYSPAITDFIMMVKGISHMFVTGPEVIKAAIHEEVTRDELGSAEVHAEKTGVAHFALEDEDHLFATIRDLLGFLPQNNQELPPRYPATDDPNREEEAFETIVPANPNQPYDMHDFITLLVDDGHFLEVHEHFATNMITGFARLDGRTVGIVANQPAILAGCVDILAAEKAGRFVRLCDVFNIPILTLADVSGFLPGVTQEHGGIIRRAAKMPYAYAEATVPKITLILRKAYGGGYGVMCCKPLGADINLAYPSAEIAVMGSEGAVNVLFGKQLKKAKDPEAMRQRLLAEYRETFAHPYKAAEIGTIDGVIHPRKTRPILIRHLRMLENKRVFNPEKKHGNMPF